METTGIKCVVFDLDGTIGDTLPICINAFRATIEPIARRTFTDAEILATFGPSEEGTIMALVPEHYDKALADYLFHYEALHKNCTEPFPGMGQMLASLKERGIYLALVTGKGAKSCKISLSVFGLEGFFDHIETGSPQGNIKTECIVRSLRAANVEPFQAIYVGDAPSDIVSSRQAGIKVIAAAWAKTADPVKLKEMEPDMLFTSLKDFYGFTAKF